MTEDLLGLTGKNAIVVGGGQGIGEAAVLSLAKAGCNVAVLDIDPARAQAMVEKVEALGRHGVAVTGDALSTDMRWMAAAEAALGPLDILISIIGSTEFRALLDTDEDQWDFEQRANLRFAFSVGKAFAAACIRNARPGAITFVSSVSGMQGAPRHAAYGAAKAGLIHLVKTMAVEWAPHGIRVNSVAPGAIITPRLPDTEEWRAQMRNSAHPMQRRGTTDEIAGPLLFLSSNLASYVTGQTLAADGGLTVANVMTVPSKLGNVRER